MAVHSRILGRLLADAEGVDDATLEAALGPARRAGERIGDTLVRLGVVSPSAVADALSRQLGIPRVRAPLVHDQAAASLLQPELARTHRLVPIGSTPRTVRVAMADPLDVAAIDNVQFQTGRRVEPHVATPGAVAVALELAYGADGEAAPGESESLQALARSMEPPSPSGHLDDELVRATRRAPVVRLVDRLLRTAVDQGASDIHVEEAMHDVRVRFRIDGSLRQVVDLPPASRRALLSRIKVLAGMDISVRRRAQDGSLSFTHEGRELTLRVSTLPVAGGEKAVVRILDAARAPTDLSELGMSSEALAGLRGLLAKGEGVVLAAGPTGSGKSTTLFAALSELDRETRNVVTLEDPVEYRLPGASQIRVDRRAGLGFPEALRAVLRQDPDVVMVGEIRDRETAEIAMAAAVTGHLVLSTIHTTDAPGAVTRLLHMGVPPFLVAGGLAGVVAQRLVRRCCKACRGQGCTDCGDGLRGRTGVYQILTVSDEMRDEISGGGSSARLRRLAADTGMRTLASDARRSVAASLTTPHEVAGILKAGSGSRAPCPRCGTGVPLGARACPGCGARRGHRCTCGQPLESGWRYCPACVRPAAAA
jgi:type IV pilus assembly protein PilB